MYKTKLTNKRKALLLSTAIAVAVPGGWSVAHAQSDSDDTEARRMTTVIVSSRKREETLADIPVAVSAVSADEIARSGFDSLTDITLRTPGVQFAEQSTLVAGRARQGIRFRGMDTNLIAPSQQVGTAFLDGIYVSTGIQALDLGALERVEVIKGPQSAIYGRNTFGGAINYITRDPSFEFGGTISAEVEDYGGYDTSIRFEGPIIADVLAARVSLRGFGTDGQYQSVADGGRLGQEETRSGNFVLLYQPTDQLKARFRAFYSEERDGQNDGIFISSGLSNFGNGPALTNCDAIDPTRAGTGATDYFCGDIVDIVDASGFSWSQLASSNTVLPANVLALLTGDTATETLSGATRPIVNNVPGLSGVGQARDQVRLMASVDYEFRGGALDGFTLSAKAGYSDVGLNWIRDFDYTAAPGWADRDAFYDRDYSLEARLASPDDQRLRYSIGVNWIDIVHQERGATGVLAFDWAGELGAFGIGGPIIFYGQPPVTEGSEAIGIFGAIGYDLTDRITIDFEGRYQEDKISQGDEFDATFDNFLPRLTLSFEPQDTTLLWATYSEGNLPGFFNGGVGDLDEAELAQIEAVVGPVSVFNDEEELKNYEIGWRQSLLDDELNVSLVGYYMEWTNQKTRVGVPFIDSDDGTSRILGVQTNAGNSELQGLEFEGTWAPTPQFTSSFSVNWAEAEYTEFTCSFAHYVPGNESGRVGCDGNRLPKYPEWSGSFMGRWQDTFMPAPDWDYFGQLSGTYFGKAFNEETNFSYFGEYWRLDLRAGLEREDLRLEAFVTNLLDEDSPESAARSADFSTSSFLGFSNNFGIVLTPPERRTFGVRASYDF